MTELLDLNQLTGKKFWDRIDEEHEAAAATLEVLWKKAGEVTLTQSEAIECLNALYIHTHQRIREHDKQLAKHYPTKQFSVNRLENRKPVWWVDHFTAGVNQWGTLAWFSAKKIDKGGKKRYPGASTHFIIGYTGYPFYIIPLNHGAWHEPKRNKDSIAVEMVNAGPLTMKKGKWHFWAGKLPEDLAVELPPLRISPPYRGATAMQPYTTDQLINNIKLKRVIRAALPGKLHEDLMSAHTDWRKGKKDTGPLWPFMDINGAAFDNIPINQYSFIQRYDSRIERAARGVETFEYNEVDNPEYGLGTPTHDEDLDSEDTLLSTLEVQTHLVKLGYRLTVDGKYGPKTKAAIKGFQQRWNAEHPDNQLKDDGIAGPETCERLSSAVR